MFTNFAILGASHCMKINWRFSIVIVNYWWIYNLSILYYNSISLAFLSWSLWQRSWQPGFGLVATPERVHTEFRVHPQATRHGRRRCVGGRAMWNGDFHGDRHAYHEIHGISMDIMSIHIIDHRFLRIWIVISSDVHRNIMGFADDLATVPGKSTTWWMFREYNSGWTMMSPYDVTIMTEEGFGESFRSGRKFLSQI
jgi:hypothetical protein